MKRPAFTLIELLITAVLFVVVAGYAVVIFSSTVGMSAQVQRTANVAGQSRQALDILSRTFAQTVSASTVGIVPSAETGTSNSALFLTITIPTSTGAPSAATEQRVFCAAPVGTNGNQFRLAEFTVAGGTYTAGAANVACTAASIAALYGAGASATGPSYLTDSTTNVTRFSAVPTQFDVAAPSGAHLVLTSVYDPTIGNPLATVRVDSGGVALPVTVEATATRTTLYTPFSGL